MKKIEPYWWEFPENPFVWMKVAPTINLMSSEVLYIVFQGAQVCILRIWSEIWKKKFCQNCKIQTLFRPVCSGGVSTTSYA